MGSRIRLSLRLLVCAFVLMAPAAFAQYSGCYTCKTIFFQDGDVYMYCADPPPLVYGNEYCAIFDDPWLYCEQWGDSCCIDPI